MADRFAVVDMSQALKAKSFPTVTLWNRVEGRPRTVNFERALRAEVRDALWMLSRQWQVGEFRGEDAGSPVCAKAHVATTQPDALRPGDAAPQPFDEAVPLEAQVEQSAGAVQRLGRHGRARPAADDGPALAEADRRHRRLLGRLSSTNTASTLPDPASARRCRGVRACRGVAGLRGRRGACDGRRGALRIPDARTADRHAYDGIGRARRPQARARRGGGRSSSRGWSASSRGPMAQQIRHGSPRGSSIASRVDARTETGEKVYVADEYYNGTLDWHNLDVDPTAQTLRHRSG